MPSDTPYNPLDKKNLGVSVADALLQREPTALPPNGFEGAGVYAIYYLGGFEPYRAIAELNRKDKFLQPVYVGKAVHKGRRIGGFEAERTSPDIAPVCGIMAERFCPRFVLATEVVDTPTSEGARANLGQNIQPESAKRTVVQTATLDTGRILHDHQQVTCEKERTGAISGLEAVRCHVGSSSTRNQSKKPRIFN